MAVKNLPNVILIILDTCGAKHMSIYDYHRRTTPYLEELAEECVVYTRCFSTSPWTSPSHASMFTGLYPSEHGCKGIDMDLNENLYSLPEVLKSLTYKTCGISSNPLICTSLGFGRGFDEFYGLYNVPYLRLYLNKGNKNKIKRIKYFMDYMVNKRRFQEGVEYIASALRIKEFKSQRDIMVKSATPATIESLFCFEDAMNSYKKTNSPFFIFINFMQTHAKFNPPRKFRNIFVEDDPKIENQHTFEYLFEHLVYKPHSIEYLDYIIGLYNQEILFIDYITACIFKLLKKKNLFDKTLLILTSDHGELLGEHGLVEHSFCLYNENLYVPLIIKYPKEYGLKGVVDSLVQNHDIFATILKVTNAPYPVPKSSMSLLTSDKRQIGISQLIDPRFKIAACLKRKATFLPKDFMLPHISIITDDLWKITKRADGHTEIYDLNNDLYENNNLMSSFRIKEKRVFLQELVSECEISGGYKKAIPKSMDITKEIFNCAP